MPAPFTTPPTFTPGQIVGATDFNAYLRDNPLYLLARPHQSVLRDNAAAYTTTSTSFVDIDATNLKITISISGSAVLVGFAATCSLNNTAYASFDIDVDGTRWGAAGAEGIVSHHFSGGTFNVSFVVLVTGLSVASHTLKIKWKTSANTLSLYSGAAGSGFDYIPNFWAVEVA